MSKTIRLLTAILNLFEGEGAAPATGDMTSSAPAAGEQSGDQYDTQGAAAPENPASSLEERTKAFRDLVNGEYKDVYTQETQKMINRRFAETKNLQKTVAEQQAIIDRMTAKYGVTDLNDLAAAIDNDAEMWEAEADKAGMTTERFMELQNLKRENSQYQRQQAEQEKRMQIQAQVNIWQQEAEGVRNSYPEFNLEAELENPQFASMLRAGVPMGHAYEVMHLNDIKQQTAQSAAARTEKAVTDNIRARGARPAENGSQGHSTFTQTVDFNKMSLDEMEAYNKRARYGESIDFVTHF